MDIEQGWAWQTTPEGDYLTCALLKDFAHGFFTRQFAAQSLLELTAYLQPQAQPYRVKQIHGNSICSTSDLKQQGITTLDYDAQHPADALISTGIQEAVWVCSADCVPVLIGDHQTGQVAAIHAGWRGTALGITPLTVKKLLAQGSQLPDLGIALGPAISGAHYQVDTEVAVTLGRTLMEKEFPKPGTPLIPPIPATFAAVLAYLENLDSSPLSPDTMPGKVRLDVRRINALQLMALGILPSQITTAPTCTFADVSHFFSYRREHRKQIQWSGIVSA